MYADCGIDNWAAGVHTMVKIRLMRYDIRHAHINRHAHFGTESWCGQSRTNRTVCAVPALREQRIHPIVLVHLQWSPHVVLSGCYRSAVAIAPLFCTESKTHCACSLPITCMLNKRAGAIVPFRTKSTFMHSATNRKTSSHNCDNS